MRTFGPARVAGAYMLFGALWVLVSDALVARGDAVGATFASAQTVKGLFYVLITGALVYGLARHSTRRIREERSRYRDLHERDGRQLAALLAMTRETLARPDGRGDRDGQDLLVAVTEAAAAALGVARASIWTFDDARTRLTCRDLFEADARRHSRGHWIAAADFPEYCGALARDKVIAAHEARTDQRTREFTASELEPHDIGAMLDAPVMVDGKLAGVLCLQHVGGPRTWTLGEQTFVVSAANLLALASLQRSLRDSEAHFREMADNLPGAIHRRLPGEGWTTTFMSEGIAAITGYRPADFLRGGRVGYAGLIHPEDRDRVFREAAVAAGRSFEVEYRIRAADGAEKTVWERGRAFAGGAGSEGYLEGFVLDVTDRKRAEADRQAAEERLRQMQKLEAIGQLAGGVAHDFNNMLTVILVRAETALRKLPPDSGAQATLKEIHEAATRSAGLIRQLLTYAQRQVAMPRVIDLNALVEAALPMLRGLLDDGIRIDWSPEPGLWAAEIDPTQMDQVLVNLCLNARDALKGGGALRLATANLDLTPAACRNLPELEPGAHVVLTVSDTGAGMTPETRARLFEPFFTTKEQGKGIGLGLPTVHGIVRQNRGAIEVESAPGTGATFRIYLPRHRGAADGVPRTRGSDLLNALPSGNGETVLVADDDPAARRLAGEILAGLGYVVLDAPADETALELARAHAGAIHLLMTDGDKTNDKALRLADGFCAVRPGAGVLFMSSDAADRDENDRRHYVRKPFATAELALKIRSALSSSPARGA